MNKRTGAFDLMPHSVNLCGINLIESSYLASVPKMQVSEEFRRAQSPELVAETNKWMLEFFGVAQCMLIVHGEVIAPIYY